MKKGMNEDMRGDNDSHDNKYDENKWRKEKIKCKLK